jgi:tRNA/tmRNA/rRNA uracil-C5-methylase (TrmA/RlmC/RlmD family)
MRLIIEKLVYGGAGLARTDQGVVFVPRTAEGDVIEAEIVERKKDYATAKLTRILEPSPDRQQPYCPNYETEGCCHWQHIQYARQVDYKEEILRETLKRSGHVEWNGELHRITGPDRNYRLRAVFHLFDGRVGFVHGPIRECASLVPELNQSIPAIEARGAREVYAFSAPEVVTSIVLHDGSIKRSGRATIAVDGLVYRVTADSFFQANRYLLTPFVTEVITQAGPRPRRLLELFAGSGFFSIPLARAAQEVIAIESSRWAVRQARENAAVNGVSHVRFAEGLVEETIRRSDLKPDVVVLDPPRAGCGVKTAKLITGLRPERIVYIACNPSTFAREASTFIQNDYSLQRLVLVDQFPNTYHIETVALFCRG